MHILAGVQVCVNLFPDVLYEAEFPAKSWAGGLWPWISPLLRWLRSLVEMRLGSSDSRLSIDINSLIYDSRFLWHLSIPISTLFTILGWGHSSYVGSVLKKIAKCCHHEQRAVGNSVNVLLWLPQWSIFGAFCSYSWHIRVKVLAHVPAMKTLGGNGRIGVFKIITPHNSCRWYW